MAKAIDTRYAGYMFRSRLEARWAVFFTEFGLEWEYEPEGFTYGGVCYLPDFHLTGPDIDLWIEIKPNWDVSEADGIKMLGFVHHVAPKLDLLVGVPGVPEGLKPQGVEIRHVRKDEGCSTDGAPFQIIECPCCGGFGSLRVNEPGAGRLVAGTRTPKLIRAYEAARGERFGRRAN